MLILEGRMGGASAHTSLWYFIPCSKSICLASTRPRKLSLGSNGIDLNFQSTGVHFRWNCRSFVAFLRWELLPKCLGTWVSFFSLEKLWFRAGALWGVPWRYEHAHRLNVVKAASLGVLQGNHLSSNYILCSRSGCRRFSSHQLRVSLIHVSLTTTGTAHWTLHSEHLSLLTTHYTLHIIHWVFISTHFTYWTYITAYYTSSATHFPLHTRHWTLHTEHGFSAHCTLHTIY